MQTDCFGVKTFDLSRTEDIFLEGGYSLLKLTMLGAVCLLLWMLHTSNQRITRQTPSILKLNETPTVDRGADSSWSRLTPFILFISACDFLRQLLHDLFP